MYQCEAQKNLKCNLFSGLRNPRQPLDSPTTMEKCSVVVQEPKEVPRMVTQTMKQIVTWTLVSNVLDENQVKFCFMLGILKR